MKKIFLHLLILPLFFSACETSSESNKMVSTLGFKNPKALFISAGNATARGVTKLESTTSPDTLFQMLPDGTIEKVAAYDTNGNELAVRVDDIQKLTNDYVAIRMVIEKGDNGRDSIPYGLLVKTENGKIYDMTKYAIMASTSRFNKPPVVWGDYIYTTASEFVNEGYETLYRINMTTLEAEPMNMESIFTVADFRHISNGNILFKRVNSNTCESEILFNDTSQFPVSAKPENVNLEWFYSDPVYTDDGALCNINAEKTGENYSLKFQTYKATTAGLEFAVNDELYKGTEDDMTYYTHPANSSKYSKLYIFKHGYIEINSATATSVDFVYTEKPELSAIFEGADAVSESDYIIRDKKIFWLKDNNIMYYDIINGTQVETLPDFTGVSRIEAVGDCIICTKFISTIKSQTYKINLKSGTFSPELISESTMEVDKIVEFSL